MASFFGLNPPSKIQISSDGKNEATWTCFKEDFSYFMLAAGFNSKTDEEKIALLINVGGAERKDIYNGLTWAAPTEDVPDESKVYTRVTAKMDAYFNVKKKQLSVRECFCFTIDKYDFFNTTIYSLKRHQY